VLAERTRLAQDLHDTVEQTLTGIAFQLDSATKLHERDPESSRRHLELARSLMDKSQEEMRQSVWDLRSRALEQFDLSNALAEGARQITCGTDIQVHVETKGQVRPLPEVVEENLLRIGQEALSNVIKHSRSTTANIELVFAPQQVVLQINDTGHGFDHGKVGGPQEGHFGLLGMAERTKRLGGRFTLASIPGQGTTIRVEIPIDQSQNFKRLQPSTHKFPMKNSEKIRILIADDHYIVRMGLIAVINSEPDMQVVAETDNGEHAIELYGNTGLISRCSIRGCPAKRRADSGGNKKQISLGAHSDPERFRWHRRHSQSFQAGVQGYVLKKKPSGEKLIRALRAVAAGETLDSR